MSERTAFERSRDQRRAVKAAEAAGAVADSLAVRTALMARVRAGEITLAQAQAELKKIQRNALVGGQMTRAQAYREG